MVKKPFGGSSWLLIFFFILDFYDFIFAFLVWGFVVRGGAANIFGFFGGWEGVLQLFFLLFGYTPPQSLYLEKGIQALGEGQKSAGSGFQGDSGSLGAREE